MDIRIHYTIWDDAYAGMIFDSEFTQFRKQPSKIARLIWEDFPKGGAVSEPSFRLERASVQDLFNQLWQEGFRPSDGTGNSGHVGALQYHLEDMRRLVFKGGQDDKK